MTLSHAIRGFICTAAGSIVLLAAAAYGQQEEPTGARVYRERCAGCHDMNQGGNSRSPPRDVLETIPQSTVLRTLTSGSMKPQATGLSDSEIRAVAQFVSTPRRAIPVVREPDAPPDANMCAKRQLPPLRLKDSDWNGWGPTVDSARFQANPGFTAAQVPDLKLKWAFTIPGGRVHGYPTAAGGRVFITSRDGDIFALDIRTGCTAWHYMALNAVRASVVIGAPVAGKPNDLIAYAVDERLNVYALDANSGKLRWRTRIDHHPAVRGTGSFRFDRGMLYIPLSSFESSAAANPQYACCTFQGGIAAVDGRNGKLVWKTTAIPDKPKPYRTSTAGVENFGPAGAAIWTSPTIDRKLNRVYGSTGNSYTQISTGSSNAVIAFDMAKGGRAWMTQFLANDNFITGNCSGANAGKNNCPDILGPDLDLSSSPVLRTLKNGKRVLLVAGKIGSLFAMDPDARGKRLWEVSLAGRGPFGGLQYGFAADNENAYVSVSNLSAPAAKPGGVFAIRLEDGKVIWEAPPPPKECSWGTQRCGSGQDSVPAVMPGVVFVGSLNGKEYAYSTADGRVLWQFDTARSYKAVNGTEARGGSLEHSAQILSDGTLIVASGYATSGRVGNALLAFTPDGK